MLLDLQTRREIKRRTRRQTTQHNVTLRRRNHKKQKMKNLMGVKTTRLD